MSQTDYPQTRGDTDRKAMTRDDIVAKLKKSLSASGDFPTSAKIVTELRALAMNPATTANQLAEVILREPSLGMRVLALVNSAFYRPTKPITTISQAVIQIGMKPLIEMCSGLVLLQRFVPEARKNGSFALCLRRSVMTSIISSSLTSGTLTTASKALAQRHSESGYLVGMIAEMGTVLLAFYYPQLYDAAVKRSEDKGQPLAESIKQLFGLTPFELSSEIIAALGLPQYYADALKRAEEFSSNTSNGGGNEDLNAVARCLACATSVAETINTEADAQNVIEAVEQARAKYNLAATTVQTALRSLSLGLKTHCDAIQLTLPDLPVDLTTIELASAENPTQSAQRPSQLQDDDEAVKSLGDFTQYLQEIRFALQNNEPTATIITTSMEACAYCLNFNRVILLLANKERKLLTGRMALGDVPNFTPGRFTRSLTDSTAASFPDYQAFVLGQTTTVGTPLFKDGHTVAALPIGSGRRTVGVIYAERSGSATQGISLQEHSALTMLATLLDKAVQRIR